jgi:hypothetical protein
MTDCQKIEKFGAEVVLYPLFLGARRCTEEGRWRFASPVLEGQSSNMESLKPLLLMYGAKGLMLLRKSKFVLKFLVEKHRGKLLAGLAVGMGATAYLQSKLSKTAPSESSKPVCIIRID